MKKYLLLILLAISCVTHAKSNIESSILEKINYYRIMHGRGKLIINPKLNLIAKKHSEDMALHKIPFGHLGFNQRFKQMREDFPQYKTAAENVAYRYPSAQIVVDGWISSRGHRKNLLGNYKMTGIGVFYDKKGYPWYTQIFLG